MDDCCSRDLLRSYLTSVKELLWRDGLHECIRWKSAGSGYSLFLPSRCSWWVDTHVTRQAVGSRCVRRTHGVSRKRHAAGRKGPDGRELTLRPVGLFIFLSVRGDQFHVSNSEWGIRIYRIHGAGRA